MVMIESTDSLPRELPEKTSAPEVSVARHYPSGADLCVRDPKSTRELGYLTRRSASTPPAAGRGISAPATARRRPIRTTLRWSAGSSVRRGPHATFCGTSPRQKCKTDPELQADFTPGLLTKVAATAGLLSSLGSTATRTLSALARRTRSSRRIVVFLPVTTELNVCVLMVGAPCDLHLRQTIPAIIVRTTSLRPAPTVPISSALPSFVLPLLTPLQGFATGAWVVLPSVS